jgi:hypothetical protein
LLRAAATRPPYSFTLSSTVFLALAAITTHMIMSVLLSPAKSAGAEIITWKKAHDDLVLEEGRRDAATRSLHRQQFAPFGGGGNECVAFRLPLDSTPFLPIIVAPAQINCIKHKM